MQSGLSALLHLRATLEAIGDAVRDGRTDLLLQHESSLGDALERLRGVAATKGGLPPGGEPGEWRAAVQAARKAIRRSERLGGSARDVVRAVLVAQGRAGAYDRDAHEAFRPARGAVDARG